MSRNPAGVVTEEKGVNSHATPSETVRDSQSPGAGRGNAHRSAVTLAPEDDVKRSVGVANELGRRFSFTPSEVRIALLLAEGLTYKQIALDLGVSYHTVHTHVKAIHLKARVSSNGRLVALIRKVERG